MNNTEGVRPFIRPNKHRWARRHGTRDLWDIRPKFDALEAGNSSFNLFFFAIARWVRAGPKLQLLWGVSSQQWSISIQRGPRKEQRSMSRAKAHPGMWESRADLSGLTQPSSSWSLECYLEEVHTGSGRKVSGDAAHNNLLSMRQNKGCIEGFWPGLPDPRNLRNSLHFNRLCRKQQANHTWWESHWQKKIKPKYRKNFFTARGSCAIDF